MRVLIDTNVVLDVLLKRDPWAADAAEVWQLCTEGSLTGYLSASSFTDIFYIARRHTDRDRARTAVRLLLDTFAICTIDQSTLEMAYALAGSDFEDNLQMACSVLGGLEFIVTRDSNDFRDSPVPAVTCAQLLQRILKPQSQRPVLLR